MSKVIHGGNIDELSRNFNLDKSRLIDFSANINPLGMNDNVKKVIIQALDEIEKYPDITYFNLKSAISKFEGIESENLTLGNGAAEVIFNLVRAIKPKKVLSTMFTLSRVTDILWVERQRRILPMSFTLRMVCILPVMQSILTFI